MKNIYFLILLFGIFSCGSVNNSVGKNEGVKEKDNQFTLHNDTLYKFRFIYPESWELSTDIEKNN